MLSPCQQEPALVQGGDGEPRDELGERLLVIDALDRMAPFLMTIVSDSDLWMYVSSGHGLTCGRGVAERCLFPYETDDRLHTAGGRVGPTTIFRVHLDESTIEWRPFHQDQDRSSERRLYKSALGDRIIFEERHTALGLTFRYQWAHCDAFGFVRTSELSRHDAGASISSIDYLDGLRGIMPAGVELGLQQSASNLVNAYRRSEIIAGHPRFAIYALSARIVDRAEPSEALRANVVWSTGPQGHSLLLDDEQLPRFRGGEALNLTSDHRGRPGAYLLTGHLTPQPGERITWDIAADVGRSQSEVVTLLDQAKEADVAAKLRAEVRAGRVSLKRRLAAADGLQETGRPLEDVHHLANTTFNCLRGGIFLDDYRAPRDDFCSFVESRHRGLFRRHEARLQALPETIDCRRLLEELQREDQPQLLRLTLEYLPLTLGRRHGDPSRPWNRFNIRSRGADGEPHLFYEGNWRDIFQNWEALLYSFPGFLPHVIAKFVNASTLDGFNPYRITRDGIDWEVPEPDDPWSYIGYWGDHQIVYLTRLLEAAEAFWPGMLRGWLETRAFSYADVPYRLRSHQEILRNPRSTVDFDHERAALIDRRVADVGADGRLVTNDRGEVHLTTLAEKLLVPVLAKLGQLVVDGGIWMNTQRPEWNDANNALAGHGLSMVTLYQLRRHIALLDRLFSGAPMLAISAEVSTWVETVTAILEEISDAPLSDQQRRNTLDRLSTAFEAYRERVYAETPSEGPLRDADELRRLFSAALSVLDESIGRNRRPDGLYHAYNLLTVDDQSARVETMYEMLEGQVAVLGSGRVEPSEAVEILDSLFESSMYREDQQSFMLYPDRLLPGFLEKNVVSPDRLARDALLAQLLQAEEQSIVEKDARGDVRFCADFRNGADLEAALDRLAQDASWTRAVESGRATLAATFEDTFDHHSFTGRSGTMFGYEGLGSIYWHMVSKLLLATQEALHRAQAIGAPADVARALKKHYRRIRSGLGSGKSSEVYGAFPTDPYSHTPKHAGAQQPGMTGQVKEEILTRLGELGVQIEDGCLSFSRGLLEPEDFRIEGETASLRFSFAGIPVRYRIVAEPADPLAVTIDGTRHGWTVRRLPRETSQRIFARDPAIQSIEVTFVRGRDGFD